MLVEILSTHARQVIWAGTGRQLIHNTDLTNRIYLGENHGFDPAGQMVDIVEPLGSLAVDGHANRFALCDTGAGPLVADVIAGGVSVQPSPAQAAQQIAALGLAKDTSVQDVKTTLGSPAQDGSVQAVKTTLGSPAQDGTVAGLPTSIAAQVAASGSPLLAKYGVLADGSETSIVPGDTIIVGTWSISQTSYEIGLNVHTAAGAKDYVTIRLQFTDSVSGLLVGQRTCYVVAGNSGNAHSIVGTGPMRGDTVTLSVITDSLNTANMAVYYTLVQTSRLYTRDEWKTIVMDITAYTTSGVLPDANILTNSAPSIASGASQTRLLPLFGARVGIEAETTSGAADAEILIAAAGSVMSNYPTVYHGYTGAGGRLVDSFPLPDAQCLLTVTNHAAAQQTLSFSVVVDEQIS